MGGDELIGFVELCLAFLPLVHLLFLPANFIDTISRNVLYAPERFPPGPSISRGATGEHCESSVGHVARSYSDQLFSFHVTPTDF